MKNKDKKIIDKETNKLRKEKTINDNKEISKNKVLIIILTIIILLIVLVICIYIYLKNNILDGDNVERSNISTISSTEENISSENIEEQSSEEESEDESDDEQSKNTNSSIEIKEISARKTGYDPLDSYISGILSKNTNKNDSARDRLYDIYNYVKNTMVYDMNPPTESGLNEKILSYGYSSYDAGEMTLAYNAAKYHRGVCDDYAALLMILARASGIEVWQYGGLSAKGSSHAWNIIFVDGNKYLIDANYKIFLKSFSSSGYTEQMDGKSYFNYFKTKEPEKEEKKISWLFNSGYSSQRFYGNDNGKITKTVEMNRPMFTMEGTLYPTPISPLVNLEGSDNSFSATVSSDGKVIENLKEQSGSNQNYTFSWYPEGPGSYVIEIIAKSDDVFEGHFIIKANITE